MTQIGRLRIMNALYFNWEYRPAVILDTPQGGLEGLIVPRDSEQWCHGSPVEILHSGNELTHSELMEMFPTLPPLERAGIDCSTQKEGHRTRERSTANGMATVAWIAYWIGNVATFVKLTFFDGYEYTSWNWIIAIPVNEFLALIWPIYWAVLRPIFGS